MSAPYRINVRFDLDAPEEQQAVKFLRNLSSTDKRSRNQFIVDAVIARIRQTETERDFTLDDIQRVVREELQSVSLVAAALEPSRAPELTKEQEEENARNVLLDLEMFG